MDTVYSILMLLIPSDWWIDGHPPLLSIQPSCLPWHMSQRGSPAAAGVQTSPLQTPQKTDQPPTSFQAIFAQKGSNQNQSNMISNTCSHIQLSYCQIHLQFSHQNPPWFFALRRNTQARACQPGGKISMRYPMLLGAVRQDVRFTVTWGWFCQFAGDFCWRLQKTTPIWAVSSCFSLWI